LFQLSAEALPTSLTNKANGINQGHAKFKTTLATVGKKRYSCLAYVGKVCSYILAMIHW